MNIEQERVEFETKFPMPDNCQWCGNGYAPTEFGAWKGQSYEDKFKGWIARAAIEADRQCQPRADTETLHQLNEVLQYLENEVMKLEASYGHSFKPHATKKARDTVEKLKEVVYTISKRRGISNECEPVVLATYYAIVDESEKHIMQDMRTNQLEIYDERKDAVKSCPNHLSVVPVYVTATEEPLYTAPQPAELSRGEQRDEWLREVRECAEHVATTDYFEIDEAISKLMSVVESYPQPAETVVKESLTVAEPEKVPSDAQINEITMRELGKWPSFEAQSWACKVVRSVFAYYGHPVVPDGWQLVPIEPDYIMKAAARNASIPAVLLDSISARADLENTTRYKAMLEVAPKFGEEK